MLATTMTSYGHRIHPVEDISNLWVWKEYQNWLCVAGFNRFHIHHLNNQINSNRSNILPMAMKSNRRMPFIKEYPDPGRKGAVSSGRQSENIWHKYATRK